MGDFYDILNADWDESRQAKGEIDRYRDTRPNQISYGVIVQTTELDWATLGVNYKQQHGGVSGGDRIHVWVRGETDASDTGQNYVKDQISEIVQVCAEFTANADYSVLYPEIDAVVQSGTEHNRTAEFDIVGTRTANIY